MGFGLESFKRKMHNLNENSLLLFINQQFMYITV